MIKKFYEQTGMYIDWQQLESLPEIDTFVDIGVGTQGTEDMYRYFKNSDLILIDPIDEAKEYAKKLSRHRNVIFYQNVLGDKDNVEKSMKIQNIFQTFLCMVDGHYRIDFWIQKNFWFRSSFDLFSNIMDHKNASSHKSCLPKKTMKGPRKREASQPAYDLRFRAPFGCPGRWS